MSRRGEPFSEQWIESQFRHSFPEGPSHHPLPAVLAAPFQESRSRSDTCHPAAWFVGLSSRRRLLNGYDPHGSSSCRVTAFLRAFTARVPVPRRINDQPKILK